MAHSTDEIWIEEKDVLTLGGRGGCGGRVWWFGVTVWSRCSGHDVCSVVRRSECRQGIEKTN